jgi:hypothetical protein
VICIQCGAEYRRDLIAQGKRCAPCVLANRHATCVDCNAAIERPPGKPGQMPKRCDACWIAAKQQRSDAARLRAMQDPDRAERYRASNRERAARYRAAHHEKVSEQDRAAKAAAWRDPEKRLRMKMRSAERKYRLGAGGYLALLEQQNYRCALCGVPFNDDRRLAVDHDHLCCAGEHACGRCVRGLLCADCNRGLAAFRDDTDVLRKAIDYLAVSRRPLPADADADA